MKRKLKDISLGTTEADIAIAHILGDTLTEMIFELNKDNIHTQEIDINLTINGKEYDYDIFLQHLSSKYFSYLERVCKNLITNEFISPLTDLVSIANDAQNKIESIMGNIPWDIRILEKRD